MPVSPETLRRPEAILKNRSDAVHSLLDETTRLPFSGDVIPLPAFRKAVSPGDLFILLGIAGGKGPPGSGGAPFPAEVALEGPPRVVYMARGHAPTQEAAWPTASA